MSVWQRTTPLPLQQGQSDTDQQQQQLRPMTPLQGAPPPGLGPVPLVFKESRDGEHEGDNGTEGEDGKEEWTEMDKYGLRGLLSLIKGENTDQNTVALGTDVNLLGLDMSEASLGVKLSKTFPSPWVETSRSDVEPHYVTPDRFTVDDVPPLQDKISLFTDETLFYLFYTRPRDVLQELSARELMNRNWRYHKDLQVWLTKDSNTEPVQQSPQSERGVYIFFDPHSWEKVRKEFVLYYQSIMV